MTLPAVGPRPHKIPESVLVVIHTPDLQVLLIERADKPGYWQSVTGSKDAPDEPVRATCVREVAEETGIAATADALVDWRLSNRFPILPPWQGKFAPGVSHNLEHVFSLPVPAIVPVRLAPDEHTAARWLPWQEAAEAVFSWTNRDAIRLVARTLNAARFPEPPQSSF